MNSAATLTARDAGSGADRSVQIQRWSALIGGGTLAVYGLTRRSTLGAVVAAAGGALAYLGATADSITHERTARGTVLLNCSPADAYRFWRDFTNLQLFMRHIESVTVDERGRSRWTAIGPMGTHVSWTAEVIGERENEYIAWRSLPGSDLDHEGTVEFRPAPGNRGTIVDAIIRLRPLRGPFAYAVSKMFGKTPRFMMQQDLRRFKALIESGEIPTTEGQSHGPRDLMTGFLRVANPDQPVARNASLARQIAESRRAS